MGRIVNQRLFLFCVGAPKHEDNRCLPLVQLSDNRVGKLLPSHPTVRTCLSGTYRQYRVEQQNSLFRPFGQTAVSRIDKTDILRHFLINILQRRRNRYPHLHRKRQPVRLSRTMIRVLAENDDLDVFIRSQPQSIVNVHHRWINGVLGILHCQKLL